MFLYLFLLSIHQASSPPSIMQVCLSIACFSIYLFRATTPATPLTRLCNNQVCTGPGGQPVTSMGGYMISPQQFQQHIQHQGQPGHLPLHMQQQQPPPQQVNLSTKKHRIFSPPD